MKKILIIIAAVSLIFALCCVSVYATDENTPALGTELGEEAEGIIEPSEEGAEAPEAEPEAFYSGWISERLCF